MFLCILLCIVTFGGCLKESTGLDSPNGSMLTITLRMPGFDAAESSRAMTQSDENAVVSIDLLVFDESGNFAYTYNSTDIVSTAVANEKRCKVEIKRSVAAETYSLVFLANLPDGYIASLADGFTGLSKADVLKQIRFSGSTYYTSGKWKAADGAAAPFPMWGEHAPVKLTSNTVLSKVAMTRSVARIDVGLNFKSGFENPAVDYTGDYAAQGLGTDFVITKVQVRNVRTAGYVVPQGANWTGDPKLPSVAGLPAGEFKTSLDYPAADGKSVIREIYVAESDIRGTANSADMTCLLIQGRYKGGADTWYRVDFYDRATEGAPADARLDVLRNHRYIVNITGVSGAGYPDPDTALDSDPAGLDAEVVYWDRTYDNYVELGGLYPGFADVLYFKGDGTLAVGRWGDGNVTQANLAFFKFGSVVGFTMISDTDTWDAGDVKFNPVTGTPSYGTYNLIPGYYPALWENGPLYRNISTNFYHRLSTVKEGRGDPARLVGMTAAEIQGFTTDAQLYAREAELKAAGKGGWRTVTMKENCMFISGTTSTSSIFSTVRAFYPNPSIFSNASFVDAPNYSRAYFPVCADGTFVDNGYSPMYAAGCRMAIPQYVHNEAEPYLVGSCGMYWTGDTMSNSVAHQLWFESQGALAGSALANNHFCGMPVRVTRPE